MPSSPLPNEVESILLVRLSARGDVTFASGLVPLLRQRYPRARIGWVVEEASADLVQHNPGLDEVIVMPRGRWKTLRRERRYRELLGEMGAFARDLRSRGYQVAIDLQGLFRSGLVTWVSGAPVRIGLGSKEGSQTLMTRRYPRDQGDVERISSEYVHLAEELGLDPGEFPLDVHLDPADEAAADRRVGELGLEGGFIAWAPFTTRPQKHWFEDRWAELGRRLAEEPGTSSLPVVILGGPDDREAAKRITGASPAPLVNLAGETRLGEAAALVRRASGFVGVDTGLTQLSIAFRRPTVVLFGSTTPYLKPPNPRTRILYHRLPCSPCGTRPTCDGEFTCMRRIEVEEVVRALGQAMAESEQSPFLRD